MPWLIEESAQVQGDYTHHTGLNHRQSAIEEFDNDEAVRWRPGWYILYADMHGIDLQGIASLRLSWKLMSTKSFIQNDQSFLAFAMKLMTKTMMRRDPISRSS